MTKSADELHEQADLCRRLAQDTEDFITKEVLKLMAEDLMKAARAEEQEDDLPVPNSALGRQPDLRKSVP